MTPAATILKKILAANPTTRFTLFNHEEEDEYEWSEAEWNKRKKGTFFISNMDEDRNGDLILDEGRDAVGYNESVFDTSKVRKVTLIDASGLLITTTQAKRVKKVASITVSMYNEIGYVVTITKTEMHVGCQKHSWAHWAKEGRNIIESYTRFSADGVRTNLNTLLASVLENKDRLIAKLNGTKTTKKTVKKVVAKKTVKKATRKTTKK